MDYGYNSVAISEQPLLVDCSLLYFTMIIIGREFCLQAFWQNNGTTLH